MSGVDSISPYLSYTHGLYAQQTQMCSNWHLRYRTCTWSIIPYVTDFLATALFPGVQGIGVEVVGAQSQSSEGCVKLKQYLHLSNLAFPVNTRCHKVVSTCAQVARLLAAAFRQIFCHTQSNHPHHIQDEPQL